jgi:hypothetical protein
VNREKCVQRVAIHFSRPCKKLMIGKGITNLSDA